ncbi:MAG TPA: S8 family serine peptidase [Gaiellaceae bacterium]
MINKLLCVVAAALVLPAFAFAFPNGEPLASDQWYLTTDRAWDYWKTMPQLNEIKVAVIDSGIDYGHPEFAGRIVAGKSFVGGSWKRDTDGHGTFVAGLIAANPANNEGIAGMAFNAKLLIAKVVPPDDAGVDLPAEVEAIKWAVSEGARVINLSLGGQRDPEDLRLDEFSPAEEQAIEYAVSKGVVVVAAAGNGTASPSIPWIYADYPAALPHVIGVSAIRQNGSVPAYSNRDAVYVDLAAPGDNIVSTIPRNLIDATQADCAGVPYSTCGPPEFRDAIGTSFAAPQVSAAAALLLGVDPKLTADQVSWLLERSAVDESPSTGCPNCKPGRDSLTGWGRLDVDRALTMLATGNRLPMPDKYEPNDEAHFAGTNAHPFGAPRTISASLDFWDDPVDVYSISIAKGRRVFVRVSPSTRGTVALVLWKPGTTRVDGPSATSAEQAATGVTVGSQKRLSYLATASGTYYIEVKFVPPARNRITYALAVSTKPG